MVAILMRLRRPRDPSEALAAGIPPPPGLRASRMRVGIDEIAVLTFPVATCTLPESATEAEQAIARALLAGESNAEIAAARGTSTHTVAKQVSSLLRKLGVHSRAEALAALFQPPPRRRP